MSSPPPGRSTLTTSAPRSPRSIVANGPASTREKSATRTPSRAAGEPGRAISTSPTVGSRPRAVHRRPRARRSRPHSRRRQGASRSGRGASRARILSRQWTVSSRVGAPLGGGVQRAPEHRRRPTVEKQRDGERVRRPPVSKALSRPAGRRCHRESREGRTRPPVRRPCGPAAARSVDPRTLLGGRRRQSSGSGPGSGAGGEKSWGPGWR